MSDQAQTEPAVRGIVRGGRIELGEPVDWPDGSAVIVTPTPQARQPSRLDGHVIVAGFGLAGRCVADLLRDAAIPCRIVERNPETVETQRALGRDIIAGDITTRDTLISAGLSTAAALALTIPDEDAVLEATKLTRRLRAEIYIIARTNYSSKGMRASQLGADDVVKAEQAVARQFGEYLSRHIRRSSNASA